MSMGGTVMLDGENRYMRSTQMGNKTHVHETRDYQAVAHARIASAYIAGRLEHSEMEVMIDRWFTATTPTELEQLVQHLEPINPLDAAIERSLIGATSVSPSKAARAIARHDAPVWLTLALTREARVPVQLVLAEILPIEHPASAWLRTDSPYESVRNVATARDCRPFLRVWRAGLAPAGAVLFLSTMIHGVDSTDLFFVGMGWLGSHRLWHSVRSIGHGSNARRCSAS